MAMFRDTFIVLLVVLLAAFSMRGAAEATKPLPHVEPLTITTAAGKIYHFKVEIAETPLQQQVGLMYRTEMPEDHGMLFWFGPPAKMRGFWMKNTLIPLDMVFVGEEGKIVSIFENAEPETLTPRMSEAPHVAVIELNGGITAKLGITAEDIVAHRFFDDLKP